MKTFGLTLLVLGLALASTPAIAQGGQTTFNLVAYSTADGASGWFTIEGESTKNPTLTVPANTEITVNLKIDQAGDPHNFCYVDGKTCTTLGEDDTITFTSPASGTAEYFCSPHKSAGMKGTVAVAGSATPTSTPETKDTPGIALVGIVLAGLGAALLAGRRRAL